MTDSEHLTTSSGLKVILLAGGVGGAKLAEGLACIVQPENLTVVVNTGDDFKHFGLTICPDLDTVMYTLAGAANPETGWGRVDETWKTLGEIGRLGGPGWFSIGDLDLATHLTRTHLLNEGMTLTSVTDHLCQRFGIPLDVLPMSDQAAPTFVETDGGILPFQTWFVKEKWQPRIRGIHLPDDVRASSRLVAALEQTDIVIIAPSNPFVSIDPVLNVYPVREMVMDLPKAVVAVTPIIGGRAVKGPAAKMMEELDMPVTAAAVAGYYGNLLDGFVLDQKDEDQLDQLDVAGLVVNTLMRDRDDRIRLAQDVMAFSKQLAGEQ